MLSDFAILPLTVTREPHERAWRVLCVWDPIRLELFNCRSLDEPRLHLAEWRNRATLGRGRGRRTSAEVLEPDDH